MRYESLPKKIQEENDALAALYFSDDNPIEDWETFEQLYASDEFKQFFRRAAKKAQKLLEQGIIIE